jgi:hypothetical protein
VYQLLEKNKDGPLTLGAQLYPVLDRFEKNEVHTAPHRSLSRTLQPSIGLTFMWFGVCQVLSKYVAPLRQLAVIRLFQQLSTVFKTMRYACTSLTLSLLSPSFVSHM